MAYRFVPPGMIFLDDDGLPVAGGTLYFYNETTTTPRNVFSDIGGSVSLGATEVLDASGRLTVPIFLSGNYRIILKNALAVTVFDEDYVRDLTAAGIAPPDPTDGDDGQVWTTDGVTGSWQTPLYVPDPTGQSGKQLGTDGSNLMWEAKFAAEDFDADNLPGGISVVSGGFRVGDMMVLKGTGTIPTAAAIRSSVAVTFPVAFTTAPEVACTAKVSGVTGDSPSASVSMQAISVSTTGFTAECFAGAENNGGSGNITSTVPFGYIAVGANTA